MAKTNNVAHDGSVLNQETFAYPMGVHWGVIDLFARDAKVTRIAYRSTVQMAVEVIMPAVERAGMDWDVRNHNLGRIQFEQISTRNMLKMLHRESAAHSVMVTGY